MTSNQLKLIATASLVALVTFSFCQKPSSHRPEISPKFNIVLQVSPEKEADSASASEAVLQALKERLEYEGVLYSAAGKNAKGQLTFDIIGYAYEPEKRNDLEVFAKILTEESALEFWETYRLSDSGMVQILAACLERDSLINFLKVNAFISNSEEKTSIETYPTSVWGYVHAEDLKKVDFILNKPEIKAMFPSDLRFCWSAYLMLDVPEFENKPTYELYALKAKEKGQPFFVAKNIAELNMGKDEGEFYSLTGILDEAGRLALAEITEKLAANGNRELAIVVNSQAVTVPTVMSPILGGNFAITVPSKDVAMKINYLLKNGHLPHPISLISKSRL